MSPSRSCDQKSGAITKSFRIGWKRSGSLTYQKCNFTLYVHVVNSTHLWKVESGRINIHSWLVLVVSWRATAPIQCQQASNEDSGAIDFYEWLPYRQRHWLLVGLGKFSWKAGRIGMSESNVRRWSSPRTTYIREANIPLVSDGTRRQNSEALVVCINKRNQGPKCNGERYTCLSGE